MSKDMGEYVDLVSEPCNTALPRLLIIDHHDSYTLNLLISLLHATKCTSSQLLSRVIVLPHDHRYIADIELFQHHLLPYLDGIVLGPGPGHPSNEKDFGPAQRILSSVKRRDIRIPLLGICLGHQGIATAFGGSVVQAESLRHGLLSQIITSNEHALSLPSLFEGLEDAGPVEMIRYNSLTVDESTLPSELIVTAWSHDDSCAALPPKTNRYFSDFSSPSTSSPTSNTPSRSQRVVMGLQHRDLPIWGVQFHPESISSVGGEKMLQRFLGNCRKFWVQELSRGRSMSERKAAHERLISWQRSEALPERIQKLGVPLVASSSSVPPSLQTKKNKRFRAVTQIIDAPTPSYDYAPTVFARVFGGGSEDSGTVWLDSSRQGDVQSRFSYMSKPSWSVKHGLADRETSISIPGKGKGRPTRIHNINAFSSSDESHVDYKHGLVTPKSSRANSPNSKKEDARDFWTWFSSLQESFQACCTAEDEREACPFQTGFVGYLDYEMKKESLTRGKDDLTHSSSLTAEPGGGPPCVWFGFCDRLLAYDHQSDEWMAVFLLRDEEEPLEDERLRSLQKALAEEGRDLGLTKEEAHSWLVELRDCLLDLAHPIDTQEQEGKSYVNLLPPMTAVDSASAYKAKVEAARDYIRRGESYELCLTTCFDGTLAEEVQDGFQIYKELRKKNPAPFSAFLNLGRGVDILSTSPERFMSIDRDGKVEMKPIKGTLARAGYKEGEEDRREGKRRGVEEDVRWCLAEDEKRRNALACDPKEQAENLMIVDLIRADLLSFCAPDTVIVPSLMQVESYESVHQLVTTLQGKKNDRISTVEALKRCFPPGSMTGAPKVRSVEILERLEEGPRGPYSGILGWLGLDGAANFSVIIRTVVVNGRHVTIGAGGAITYLSEAGQEWQEVLDKVSSIATVAA
ncbi:hypothetical protein CBS101457_002260 [Exobasidium rhododendri]|nr:hypothetical protein CBS101457_002260 [Exobasidium rhododendri]